MNTFLAFLSLIFFQSSFAYAKVWNLPALDYDETLMIENKSPQEIDFSVSVEQKDESNPKSLWFSVSGNSKIELKMRDVPKGPWLRIRSFETRQSHAAVQIYFDRITKYGKQTVIVPEGSSLQLKSDLKLNKILQDYELNILNSSSFLQKVDISIYDDSDQLIKSIHQELSPSEHFKLLEAMCKNQKCSYSVMSDFSLTAWMQGDDNSRYFLAPLKESCPQNGNPQAVRFLLSNPQLETSYQVELTDPDMISQARRQLVNPGNESAFILIAEIQSGHGGYNQDLFSSLKSSWSWHISRPIKFAEIASSYCEGNPQALEDFIYPWLKSNRPICFWNYKIIKELSSCNH